MVKRRLLAVIFIFLFAMQPERCFAQALMDEFSVPAGAAYRDSLEYTERYIHSLSCVPSSGSAFFSVRGYGKEGVEYRWLDMNCEILGEWVGDDPFSADMTRRECAAFGGLRPETVQKIIDVYNGRLKEALFATPAAPPAAAPPAAAPADSVSIQPTTDSSKAPSAVKPSRTTSITDRCAFSDSLGKADALKKSLWLGTGCIFVVSAATGPLLLLFAAPAISWQQSPPEERPAGVVPGCYNDAYVKTLDSRKFRNHLLALLGGMAIFTAITLQ
jgi:hypothetical protein